MVLLIESRIRVMMRRVSGVRLVAARPEVRSPLTMREIPQPDGRNGATLAIYADERNPCLWANREGSSREAPKRRYVRRA